MINIFLISLHPAVQILHQAIGNRILINPSVSRHLIGISGTSNQRNPPILQHRINRRQRTGVISRTKINTNRILLRTVHRPHILHQPANILHRHQRNLLQNIRYRLHSIQKRNNPNTFLHHAGIITHPHTPNTGNPGKKLLKLTHMRIKLILIRKQHNKLRTAKPTDRFRQITELTHTIKLPHAKLLLSI